ncbi:hypothetical protein NOF04DRAFT_1056567 [Fusarium oxysporum II5]|uniref:Uncharacterized protein n=2 Tax=Fusarium oxysporum species complex TaxID=171631 RepID=X0K4C8_FUSO5|nr:uncharacterized protein FOIG_05300 [Fusarium odoratissimum NRRL 54006]EXM03597.1 hypothetical protein FOIG_05300 [Fusarium odoratissimum NRRL 54006]KAK2131982.1 hypothetical protein NOF04DRAFT_1056567 [Fusarium oxysporum II5]TXC09574.1 hypothetical protein FocTR4_00005903 [Fusarium oxysporum f. sp. cubense]
MSSRGVPEVLFKKVDEYVDSLAPQIQPRITSELETFQQKTIDSLEDKVVDAFRSLFNKDKDSSSRSPFDLKDDAPDAYGGQSLPFADELAKLTRSFTKITDEAGDDLRDIFDITEGRAGGQSDTRSRGGETSRGGAKGFLSAAFDAVQDHLENNNGRGGGQGFELDGLLGVISNTVKDAARNPEEKARMISPEIKEQVGAKLREQHAPIAEQFTRIALDHIKRWLRGNTSTKDLGDGVKGEIEDQVKDLVKGIGGLFGNNKKSNEGSARGFGDGDRDGERADGESGGFSKVISDKLSTGIARVHREVRLEFRKILGGIEKQLFELLPDQFQRPLEKILGGNPFDTQLDRDAGPGHSADRGFGDDIKAKLVNKIRGLVRKVQETLRESILGVVNGGHRKFERQSWVFVQNMVEMKVQKYLPKVKISVPDDIGNEGVSVGAPAQANLGGSNAPVPASQGGHSSSGQGGYSSGQGGYERPSEQHGGGYQQPYTPPSQFGDNRPDHQQSQGYRPQQSHEYKPPQGQDYRPQQSQEYRPQGHDEYRPQGQQGEYRPQHQSQQDYRPQNQDNYRPQDEYRPQQQQSHQEYRPDQYPPPPQHPSSHSGSYQQNEGYQNQGYQQAQGYQQSQGYQQNHGYQQNQGYQ